MRRRRYPKLPELTERRKILSYPSRLLQRRSLLNNIIVNGCSIVLKLRGNSDARRRERKRSNKGGISR